MIQTQLPDPTKLVLRRTYSAPRERVFAAWSDRRELKQWSAPKDFTLREYEADVRVGGAYRMTMISPEGEEYVATGTYRAVVPPERLAYTWKWLEATPEEEHDTLLTIDFVDLGDGTTEVILTHEQLRNEASRDSHVGGWSEVLDALADHLGRAA